MGYKTGASRCLIDAAEREWTMSLPDPVPLSLLEGCSCLQLRNASLGFAVGGSAAAAGSGAGDDEKASSSVPSTISVSAPTKPTASAGSGSLGTKKVRVVTSSAAVTSKPTVECTTVLEGVTLDAHQKSKIAILGKNGCGKRSVWCPLYSSLSSLLC